MITKILVLASFLVFLQSTTVHSQSPSGTISPTYSQTDSSSHSGTHSSSFSGTHSSSFSGTHSSSYSGTHSSSLSGTYSSSYSGSETYSVTSTYTNSNTYSTSGTASFSISGTVSAAIGYPQIVGIQNTINDLFSMNIVWQKPVGFNYQSYEVFLIVNGTSITFPNVLTESILLTSANTNGLVQPDTTYVVQVRGFLNGAFGPQSLPVTVSTSGGDLYGPVGTDTTSVNTLRCNYFPQNLRCRWNTGSRPWLNATFYVWCNRTVDPIRGAMAWIVQKVVNTAGSAALPELAIVPLPSGCRCSVLLTVFYATVVVRVDLTLTNAPTGFVITDKPPRPNTPLIVPT